MTAMVGCGSDAREVRGTAELDDALALSRATPGPLLLRLYTTTEARHVPFPLEDPVLLAQTFADYLAANR